MNRLKGARCYLCGAMDRDPDGGITWRNDCREQLKDIGIQWLDPTRKPLKIGNESEKARRIRKWKKVNGQYDYVAKEMKEIVGVDLHMVDVSDFLIVNLDMDIHACGTYNEIFLANSEKKPILIHVEQGVVNAPDWLFGCIPHVYFFNTWESLEDYILEVDNGDEGFEDETNRWYFFDWMGK